MVFATEPRTRHLDLRLAGELAAAGAAVLVVSQDGDAPDGVAGVATGAVGRGLAPAVAILPAQLLAWRLATAPRPAPRATFTIAAKVTTGVSTMRVALTIDTEHPDRPGRPRQRRAGAGRSCGRGHARHLLPPGPLGERQPRRWRGGSPSAGHVIGNHSNCARADAAC